MTFRLDRSIPILLAIVFVALAAVDVPRGIDGSVRQLWRECDVGAIARNFHEEGMNPLYPRIDWRGHGPGYVESEFPLYPWLVAVSYRLFGLYEVNGRIISLLASCLTLFAFVALARRLLPTPGWIAAGAFFAVSPLLLRIGTSVQPEALMFLFYITAVWLFVRWLDERSPLLLALAMASASLAILTKLPAAHIGLLFAALLLKRDGLSAAFRPRNVIAAAACLLPPLLWYAHARGLWVEYGASLGLSNKFHWVDAGALARPKRFIGLGRTELFLVWMPSGVLLAALALGLRRARRALEVALAWCATLAVFYFVTIRTTSESWAIYYHVVSIAPAGLLVGSAAIPLADAARRMGRRGLLLFVLPGAVFVAAASAGLARLASPDHGYTGAALALAATALAAAAVFLLGPRLLGDRGERGDDAVGRGQLFARAFASLMLLLVPALYLSQVAESARQFRPDRHVERYTCIRSFQPLIPEHSLIVASGGFCRDGDGHELAANASYAFYWLDRKGVNVCIEEQSIEHVRTLARDGYSYYIAEKSRMRHAEGFERAMRERFPALAECGDSVLFRVDSERDLASSPESAPPGEEPVVR